MLKLLTFYTTSPAKVTSTLVRNQVYDEEYEDEFMGVIPQSDIAFQNAHSWSLTRLTCYHFSVRWIICLKISAYQKCVSFCVQRLWTVTIYSAVLIYIHSHRLYYVKKSCKQTHLFFLCAIDHLGWFVNPSVSQNHQIQPSVLLQNTGITEE